MMVAALAVTGFVSCSNDDDDDTTYKVTYSSTYGTAPDAITVDEDTVLNSDQLPSLSATGYTFGGWFDGGTQAVAGTYKVTKDVTLTAKWGKTYVIGTYTVVVYDDSTATATKSDGTAVSATVSESTLTISDGDTSYTATVSSDGTFDTSSVKDSSGNSVTVVETVDAQTNLYGTYTGTMTVGTTSIPSTVKISADGVDQGGNYGAFTKVLWLKNTDGNYVVAAQSVSTNTSNGDLTVANYTTAASCYITFGDTITYTVPVMKTSMDLTRTLPIVAEAQTDLYGTYTGSMTVMGTASAVSLTIADGKFALSSVHPATYTKILWLKDADGNYVVAAQSDDTNTKNGDLTVLNYTTASSNYVVFGTDAITYYVPAMATMGGTCTLTLEQAKYYGDYSGSMTVTMGTSTTVSLTANVAENSITLSGNYGTYTPAFWFKDSNSNYVVAGRARANTETDVTVDNYMDKSVCGVYITFGDSVVLTIPAMASMGGTSTLTKSE